MPTDLASTLYFLGRFLLGGAFVIFGIRNIANLPRLTGLVADRKFPRPREIVLTGMAMQVVGGALVALGLWPALGAAILIVFLYGAVYLVHDFWKYSGADRAHHEYAWIMNSALAGAFLMIIAYSI